MGSVAYIHKDTVERVIDTLLRCRQELNAFCISTTKHGIQVHEPTTGMVMADECLELLRPYNGKQD